MRGCTLTLPSISDLTGVNATEPNTSGDYQLAPQIHNKARQINTKQCSQRLSSFQELGRRHGILLLFVDWYVCEGFLKGIEEGSSGWVCICGCHFVFCWLLGGELGRLECCCCELRCSGCVGEGQLRDPLHEWHCRYWRTPELFGGAGAVLG